MNKVTLAILPVFAFAIAGCEEKSPAPAKAPTPAKTTAPATTPPASTPSTVDALKDKASTASLKDQAVAAFSTKYDAIKQQIAGLKDKASSVPALTKPAYDSAMTNLDSLTKDADAKLTELKAATGDAVQKAKDALDGLVVKLNNAITAAQSTLAPK